MKLQAQAPGPAPDTHTGGEGWLLLSPSLRKRGLRPGGLGGGPGQAGRVPVMLPPGLMFSVSCEQKSCCYNASLD